MDTITNAKEELLGHVKDREVLYVAVQFGDNYSSNYPVFIEGRLSDVLDRLDFKYGAGYGGQKLFGTIWYADETWSERGEYDGSERWEHHECPPLPDSYYAATANNKENLKD